MNKDSYDNFMTSFKKKMWDVCSQKQIFEKLENSEYEKVKSIFETNIENYKTHILQTNGDDSIINLLLSNIKREIGNVQKNIETREDISNMRRDQFHSDYEKKQNEFNSLLKNEKPESLDFSDNTQDAPLEADNLEALIQEQMKDRELHIPTPSTETNNVVSGNQFTENEVIEIKQSPVKITNLQTSDAKKLEHLINENEKMISEISKLRQQINSQNDAIHKILSSQILILKKLK